VNSFKPSALPAKLAGGFLLPVNQDADCPH
jgi:hypothetical protein